MRRQWQVTGRGQWQWQWRGFRIFKWAAHHVWMNCRFWVVSRCFLHLVHCVCTVCGNSNLFLSNLLQYRIWTVDGTDRTGLPAGVVDIWYVLVPGTRLIDTRTGTTIVQRTTHQPSSSACWGLLCKPASIARVWDVHFFAEFNHATADSSTDIIASKKPLSNYFYLIVSSQIVRKNTGYLVFD